MFGWIKKNKDTIKNVVIAVLLTGVVAFVLGMKFESHANQQIEQARAEARAEVVKVSEVKK